MKRWLEAACWLVAIALGAVQAWMWRFQPSTMDLVSYLDVGDAWVRGQWKDAINGYWNPLYSWILGVVMAVVKPSAMFEYPLAKLVDFAIYLLCLCSFSWLLVSLRREYRDRTEQRRPDVAAIPDWAWIVGGYTLFIWSSVKWITLSSGTPDMAATALAYCAWALALRLERRVRRVDCVLLGLVLALSYFARTPMFLIAIVLLVMTAWRAETIEHRRGVLVAAVIFLVLTLPLVAAVSRARGHLTIGDNGALNHAWLANPGSYRIPNRHWQGGPPGYGVPEHPSRALWNAPPVYEFGRPIGGTFPPWTDPSYWYEGLRYHFDAASEIGMLMNNLRFYDALFLRWLLVGAFVALLVAGDVRSTSAAVFRNAPYWMPAASGIALYWLANDLLVQDQPTPQPPSRYVAVYVVLLVLTLASSFRFRAIAYRARATAAFVVLLAAIGVGTIAKVAVDERIGVGLAAVDQAPWRFAEDLRDEGAGPNVRVAIIGSTGRQVVWARLARARIIAEIPNEASFWAKPVPTQQNILQVLARAGVEVVVASNLPPPALANGWHMAKFSHWGVFRLNELRPDLNAPPLQ
jgi:hypothetical protein